MSDAGLLESLYGSAAGQVSWAETLARLDSFLSVEGTLLIDTRPTGFIPLHSESLVPSIKKYQDQEWFKLDDRYRAVPAMRRGRIATDLDLFSIKQIERMPYYQDFLRSEHLRWWACLIIPVDQSEIAISFQRTAKQGLFEMDDLNKIASIRSSFQEALSIQQLRARAFVEGLTSVLGMMREPAILLGKTGKVTFLNAEARKLADGCLSVVNGRLQAYDPAAAHDLETLVRSVTASAGLTSKTHPPITIRRSGGRNVIVSATCLSRVELWAPDAQALVTVGDPDRERVAPAARLSKAFGLSSAEARLAHIVASGHSLEEAALMMDRTSGYIRQLMKQVLNKSDTHRQGEFIALASRLITSINEGE